MTHSLSDWLAVVSFAVGVHASYSVPYFVLVDASRSDFPRLWQAAVHARHDVDWVAASVLRLADDVVLDARLTLRPVAEAARLNTRDVAISAAALLALLIPASPERATR